MVDMIPRYGNERGIKGSRGDTLNNNIYYLSQIIYLIHPNLFISYIILYYNGVSFQVKYVCFLGSHKVS
jgi:hypothetical protein